jgi:3',5'-cyclic AMP phosphodiesterase CpdA
MRTRRDGQSHENGSTTRRQFVQVAGAAALAMGLGALPRRAAGEAPAAASTGSGFRFVFFPDSHLRDEFGSAEGLAAALRAVERLNPRPAFLWTGGDLCHDLRALGLEPARARAARFVEIWNRNTTIPAYHMLGNHDAAGWGKGAIPPEHPDFAFGLLRRLLGLERTYYSFDHSGWHFVVLDNVHRTTPGKHIGLIDEEQLRWLRGDLSANRRTPTMVAMHVPPLTAVEFLTARAKRDDQASEWRIGFDRMSRNPDELLEALAEGSVKAVLSGHLHLVERLDLRGLNFICMGSVSGQQWMGPRAGMGTGEGFGVLDLRPDGTFDWSYEGFGWQAPPEALRAQGA